MEKSGHPANCLDGLFTACPHSMYDDYGKHVLETQPSSKFPFDREIKCTAFAGRVASRRLHAQLGTLKLRYKVVRFCVVKADKAHAELQKTWKTKQVKDLKLTAKPLGRQARLIYLPAHAVSYQYGQGFTASGERRPYNFQVFPLTFDCLDKFCG